MIFLPKEKALKFFGRFFLFLTALAVLSGSILLAGFEIMAEDRRPDELRTMPIEYTKEMDNGEKILKTYKVPESNVCPSDTGYFLKKIRDGLWMNLSKTPEKKSELYLLIADKKIFETVELVKNEKNSDLVMETLGEAVDNLKKAKDVLKEIDCQKTVIKELRQKVDRAGLAYEDIVKSLGYKNEKTEKLINDLEDWNQKNQQEERGN